MLKKSQKVSQKAMMTTTTWPNLHDRGVNDSNRLVMRTVQTIWIMMMTLTVMIAMMAVMAPIMMTMMMMMMMMMAIGQECKNIPMEIVLMTTMDYPRCGVNRKKPAAVTRKRMYILNKNAQRWNHKLQERNQQ